MALRSRLPTPHSSRGTTGAPGPGGGARSRQSIPGPGRGPGRLLSGAHCACALPLRPETGARAAALAADWLESTSAPGSPPSARGERARAAHGLGRRLAEAKRGSAPGDRAHVRRRGSVCLVIGDQAGAARHGGRRGWRPGLPIG